MKIKTIKRLQELGICQDPQHFRYYPYPSVDELIDWLPANIQIYKEQYDQRTDLPAGTYRAELRIDKYDRGEGEVEYRAGYVTWTPLASWWALQMYNSDLAEALAQLTIKVKENEGRED